MNFVFLSHRNFANDGSCFYSNCSRSYEEVESVAYSVLVSFVPDCGPGALQTSIFIILYVIVAQVTVSVRVLPIPFWLLTLLGDLGTQFYLACQYLNGTHGGLRQQKSS